MAPVRCHSPREPALPRLLSANINTILRYMARFQKAEFRIIYLTLYFYIFVTIIQYSTIYAFFYIPFSQGESH